MVRKIIPPYTPGDAMAMTRLWQSVRDLQRKNTVEINRLRDASGSGTTGQNLLSSSWLSPAATDEFVLSTLDTVHRYYLGQTRGVDQVGLLSEMGLVPGDILSASVEALPTSGQVARVQLVFTHDPTEVVDDPTDITLDTFNGIRVTKDDVKLPAARVLGEDLVTGEFAISTIAGARIPDLATHVQLNVISDSTSTAGDITWRRAMLNAGAIALPYTAPPLRSDRETDMVGADTFLEFTGDVAADIVTIPDNAAWDIRASTAMSVEVEYIVFENIDAINAVTMLTNLGGGAGWRLGFQGQNDDFIFQAIHTDGTESLRFDREDQILFKRRHLAWVRDTSGVMRVYVDGRLSDDTYTNNLTAAGVLDLIVGDNFVGGIYYVRIWDIERTQAQLIDDRHTIFADSTTNLRGDWQFNESSGKIVKNHGDVASTDGVVSGSGFKWRGPASGAIPDLNNLPIETSIAAGDFIPMVDITDDQPGKITFANIESTLNHDSLAGFVADEHVAHSGVDMIAGVGLSGGGTIDSTRTFTLDLNELGNETTIASGDFIPMVDITDSGSQKITFANFESALTPTAHAASHTDGTDDIQNATAAQKGLATATQITKLDGIETAATADQTDEEIQDIAGPLVATGGTKTGITVTYQDGTDDMDFEVAIADLTTSGTVELATVTETNTGTDATRAVTPDGLDGWMGSAQVVTVGTLSAGDVTSQVSAASLTLAGKIEIATVTETNTGTDATRAVSPDGLDGWAGSAQVVTVGTLSAGNVTSQVDAATLTAAGKIEIATGAETNTGTDATRAVSPDGLDDWTGSAQVVTVGTLSSGDVTTQVSASSATLAGRVELATDAETVTGTDTARATTPANITAKMSAPGPIGDTTPSTGEFTTGDFTGNVTPNANVFVGDTATRTIGGNDDPALQVTGITDNTTSMSLQRFSANTGSGVCYFGKSRGATIADYTVVQDNDRVGIIQAAAADGTDMLTSIGAIRFEIDDASPAASSIGGATVFLTAPGLAADDIAEVARFRADGHLELSNGIQIGGTGAANLLDDYEEGTFTPTVVGTTIAGVGTYSVQDGKYTKTGNIVKTSFQITWSAHTGTGNIKFGGLPFTSAENVVGSIRCRNVSIPTGHFAQIALVSSTTEILFETFDADGTDNAPAGKAIEAGGDIYLEITYEV